MCVDYSEPFAVVGVAGISKHNAPQHYRIWNKGTNGVSKHRKIYKMVHSGHTSVCSICPNKEMS
jgi:hypothetical protein